MKRKALGRGLSALLSNEPIEIPLGIIETNHEQPRTRFDEEELNELAESIRSHGVLQPLLVRSHPDYQGKYQLIAGERRLRAASKVSQETVPCICLKAEEAQVTEIALVENLQRSDLSPLEEARAYKHLSKRFSMTQEQIAARVGKSRESIANSLRLLNLPSNVLSSLESGELSVGHAKALLAIKNSDRLDQLRNRIVNQGLSVRETEKQVRRLLEMGKKTKPEKETSGDDVYSQDLERALENTLQTKVRVKMRGKGEGVLNVHFFDLNQLDYILKKLKIEL